MTAVETIFRVRCSGEFGWFFERLERPIFGFDDDEDDEDDDDDDDDDDDFKGKIFLKANFWIIVLFWINGFDDMMWQA